MAKYRWRARRPISDIATSNELGDLLERLAAPVLAAAREDPNPTYVASLQMRRFVSSGRRGRVTVQVGAAPVIGAAVEAKRGTLGKAIARAGG